MQTLIPLAEIIAARLIERGETVGVGESSTGGLISAALLAVPGASAYFRGGGVIYTPRARAALVNITKEEMEGMRASTEPYALLLARKTRDLLGTTWGLSETGTAVEVRTVLLLARADRPHNGEYRPATRFPSAQFQKFPALGVRADPWQPVKRPDGLRGGGNTEAGTSRKPCGITAPRCLTAGGMPQLQLRGGRQHTAIPLQR